MDLLNQVLIFAGIIAVIVGIVVQIVKNLFNISKNLLPVISIVAGIIIGIVAYPFTDLDLTLRIWSGVFAGLSAVGLYELSNNRSGSTKEDVEKDKTALWQNKRFWGVKPMIYTQGANMLDVLVAFLYTVGTIFGVILIHLIRNKGYINLPKTIDDVSRLHEVVIIMYKLREHREILRDDMSGGFAYKLAVSVTNYVNNYIIMEEKEKYILANRTTAQICKELRFFPTQAEKDVIEKYLNDNILMKYLNEGTNDPKQETEIV